jgi:hypothetical protein
MPLFRSDREQHSGFLPALSAEDQRVYSSQIKFPDRFARIILRGMATDRNRYPGRTRHGKRPTIPTHERDAASQKNSARQAKKTKMKNAAAIAGFIIIVFQTAALIVIAVQLSRIARILCRVYKK